jgi:DNA polymerase-3 subunit epsilon
MNEKLNTDRQRAIDQAAQVMTQSPLFLDTETTGLGEDAEICEIAIIDDQGQPRLDVLVKPSIPISHGAMAVHGITNEMVAGAVTIDWMLPSLMELVQGHSLVIYNAEYDMRVIAQSIKARGGDAPLWTSLTPVCAMLMYAEFHGEWNDYRQSYRWQKLSDAADQLRIALPNDLHRAQADATLTLRVMERMARATV